MTAPLDVTWLEGDPATRAGLSRALAHGLPSGSALQRSARRSVYRLELPGVDEAVVLKVHHGASGRHPLRERLKRGLALSPARREWRALCALQRAGVPVPAPRAFGRLARGDEVVVSAFVPGHGFLEALARTPRAQTKRRRALLDALARALGQLAASGYRHGDLHLGNLLWVPDCPDDTQGAGHVAILDLQRARRARRAADPLNDLVRLEFSLARAGVSAPERARVRAAAALGSRAARRFEASLIAFVRDHLRGRARRVLRIGRRTERVRIDGASGRRDGDLTESDLQALVTALPGSARASRRGGRVRVESVQLATRPFVVKTLEAAGWRRAWADALRGTPAARAFDKGRRHALLSNHAARPLAYLEERRCGLPWRSRLVLEQMGEQDADQVILDSPERSASFARALGAWLAESHALGLSHRDAKASNLRVRRDEHGWHFAWVDLEDLSGPRRLTREDRIRSLVQLNASIPDAALSARARLRILLTYHAWARAARADGSDPFGPVSRWASRRRAAPADQAQVRSEVRSEIVRRSRARNHRFRGEDCAIPD